MRNKIFSSIVYVSACILLLSSCKKLLEVNPPINSITTNELFASNKQAEWAINGIYSKLINGTDYSFPNVIGNSNFAAGLSTILGSLSSDDLFLAGNQQANTDLYASQNKLTLNNSDKTIGIWSSAYKIIYDANAVIEGIEASKSASLIDSVRKQLTGEALVLRAFSYFYLVNFFGDVPLALSTDFKKTGGLPRSPVAKVYEQIIADLVRAKPLLNTDFSVGKNERVRVNRWFAEALLARVYLYTGEYQSAINSATEVIDQTTLFRIETNISNVFTPNSSEAIFQLKPTDEEPSLMNATPEGTLLYNTATPYYAYYEITPQLLNAFDAGDKRKSTWIVPVPSGSVPAKYKKGGAAQYYTVMRLAELHLIRAEATMLLTPGAKNNAIEDLNVLRRRADAGELSNTLTAEQVIEAIAKERRTELFTEWGHRWFDLKRTGKAREVLSAIPYKQPWEGDYQFLYPIPVGEIKINSKLLQNPEYVNR